MKKVLIILLVINCFFSQITTVKIDRIKKNRLEHVMFNLTEDQQVSVTCISAYIQENTESQTYAWIINSKTRQLVWELAEAEFSSSTKYLLEYKDDFHLSRGSYEIYFSSYNSKNIWNFDNVLDFFRSKRRQNLPYSSYKKMEFTISIIGYKVKKRKMSEYQFGENKKIVLSLREMEDESYEEKGFQVNEDCDVNIYALGEIERGESFDYAWIRNIKENRIVWKMNYKNTENFGGGDKNRVFQDNIWLKKGQYILYYVSDDSHASKTWNDGLPFDPIFYGVTLYVSKEDGDKIKLINKRHIATEKALISLIKLRNNAYKKKSFRIKRDDTPIRIYALGEADDDEKMVDFSWIITNESSERVWEMRYDETIHAGGSKRNRLFDAEIKFDKGTYTVYAATNRKHAYNSWKYEKPYDKYNWGVSIYPLDNNIVLDKYNLSNNKGVIAKIVEVGDDEKERIRFTLKSAQNVIIYAIGEGDENNMYDYGWIKRVSDRKVVWRMKASRTEYAGGADKNRKIREKIFLEKGEYKLYYKSDGSHSYGDWNADPPYDQERWGITIYRTIHGL